MNKPFFWINFLHMYQPPTQSREIVDLVVRECYSQIPELLKRYPNLKITLNISGSLIELFEKYGHTDILMLYKKYVEEGRIELVGSAMYHPILALIPEEEVRHQIELNTGILKKYFGDSIKCTGFFIPEMAYSKKVAQIVSDMGFQWIIVDDICFPDASLNNSKLYTIKDTNNLKVVFRSRVFSKTFPPEYIQDHKSEIKEYLITAHDAELYGHWHKKDKGFYEKSFTDADITFLTVSEYLGTLEDKVKNNTSKSIEIELREASWETLPSDLEKNIPYPLWNDAGNEIHKNMWAFAYFVIDIVKNNHLDRNYRESRASLDHGLASCAWWWASSKIPVAFSPVTWNPTETEKGAYKLLLAIRLLEDLSADVKVKTEEQYESIRLMIWKHHWLMHSKK